MVPVKISAIVPNYNHAAFLPRCLDALLRQTFPPVEILVIDDGSTDDSLRVMERFAAEHASIRVLRNDKNSGVCYTLNRGLEAAKGDFVTFLAADDQVLPDLFLRCAEMLQRYPEAGAVSGLCEWRCEDTGLVWYQGARMPARGCYLDPGSMVSLCRSGRFSMAAQHAVFSRRALIDVGGWHADLRWFTDCFSAWVVGFRLGVCHIPEVLSVFHTARSSYFHSAKSSLERVDTIDRFLVRLEERRFADVLPAIRDSGLLGSLGWQMLRVVIAKRVHWQFVNLSFLRHSLHRTAEVVGREILPRPVARFFARVFYGLNRKSSG